MRHLAALLICASPAMAEPLPAGFVRLSDLAPQIAQDIRYARAFNFTGGVVPGYDAGECVLTRRTAEALIRAEARLAAEGFGLVVYDCYRPERAVRYFVEWADQTVHPDMRPAGAEPAGDTPPDPLTPEQVFLPGLARAELIPGGYVARASGHSVGHTVDVGLRREGAEVPLPGFADAGPCDAPVDQRADEGPDMGTGFDCFSPLSAIDAVVPPEARANRARLDAAMRAERFRGYAKEWWHFRNVADPADRPQDFPLR